MITQAKIKQHPERSLVDQTPAILSEGMVAHIGFLADNRPHVIPMSYFYSVDLPDRIYVHGGKSSRLMQILCSGTDVCVEVTQLHGLVYSRSAKYHSMNYRSAICFGKGREVTELEEKGRILRLAIERYFPQRMEGRDYRKAPAEHLQGTILVEIRIHEWSAKERTGGPKGPMDSDPAAEGTCGVRSTSFA